LNTLKIIKALIFNGVAHYNIKNRIEYLGLLLRFSKPHKENMLVKTPLSVEHIYIVSLEKEVARRLLMREELANQSILYDFVNATAGYDYEDKADMISNRSLNYLSRGSIGCWISHYRIWQIISNNINKGALVFEDDVRIVDNFLSRLNKQLNLVPDDFDLLFLASGNNYRHNMRYIINDVIFVPYQIRNGAYAYLLTRKGASKLMRLIPSVQVTRGGIDSAIGSLIRDKKIIAYHLIEPLCWVDYSFDSSTKI
jgi:GR25 family glycosyltransferase involved in LPS biosynthesis